MKRYRWRGPAGTQLAIVHYVVATRELRVVPHIGLNLPLYSTSGGRALLALESDEDVRVMVGEAYAELTEMTVKTLPQLLTLIAEVRASGLGYRSRRNAGGHFHHGGRD